MKEIYLIFCIVNCYFILRLTTEALDLRETFVEINQGALRGKISRSTNGKTYFQFLGIPYAKIPERFSVSESADGWEGLRDSTQEGPGCIQIDKNGRVSGDEECLFLNVLTPQLPFRNSSGKLPVIFEIHGTGAVALPVPLEDFLDQEVIVVTANYRNGPFGYLNAGVDTAQGNQGLKDLVLALKWVKENIDKFGGDNEKVVIRGIGSGSYAASYLTLSPAAKDLFSGAISEGGGSALCPSNRQFKSGLALSNARKLANLVDCPSSNPSYLVKCLQRVDSRLLLENARPADNVLFDDSHPQFGPSLETFIDENVFLSEEPYRILQKGTFNKVPYILGTSLEKEIRTSADVLSNKTLSERLNEEWGRVAPNTFIYEEYARDPCEISSKIREFYFGKNNITQNNSKQLENLYADRWSNKCTRDMALLYAQYAPTYLFNLSSNIFSVKVPKTFSPKKDGFVQKFASLWTSFAKTGVPNCSVCSSVEFTEWPKVNLGEDTLKWFQIDESPEFIAEDSDFIKRMDFWNNLSLNDFGQKNSETFNASNTENPTTDITTTNKPIMLPEESKPTTCCETNTTISQSDSMLRPSTTLQTPTNKEVSMSKRNYSISDEPQQLDPINLTNTSASLTLTGNSSSNETENTFPTTTVYPEKSTSRPNTYTTVYNYPSSSSTQPPPNNSLVSKSPRNYPFFDEPQEHNSVNSTNTLAPASKGNVSGSTDNTIGPEKSMEALSSSTLQPRSSNTKVPNSTQNYTIFYQSAPLNSTYSETGLTLSVNMSNVTFPSSVKIESLNSSELQQPNSSKKFSVTAQFRFNASILLSLLFPSFMNTSSETYNISFK